MNNKISVKKITDKNYTINFNLYNQFIDNKLIDEFNLICMLFNLNKDHFIEGSINTINENENNKCIFVLVKPICKEFGFSQRYIYLNLERSFKDHESNIVGLPLSDVKFLPLQFHSYLNSDTIVKTPIEKLEFKINRSKNNIIEIEITFSLDSTFYHFPMFETLIKSFLKRIFRNLQQAYMLIK